MKIVFNQFEHELELYDTEFVNLWQEWSFNNSTEVFLRFDENNLSHQYHRYTIMISRLTEILEKVNKISIVENLPEKWHYDLSTVFDSNFLQKTHEKWAQITKESWEKHLPIFNEETKEIYDSINKQLRLFSLNYNDINNAIHDIEFLYKFFMIHNVSLQKSIETFPPYSIKPEDTSFTNDVITMPFYDIGRPQYEKYCISNEILHPEISNFTHIINKLEIRSHAVSEPVNQGYIEKCINNNVPVWAPNVCIAKNKTSNPQSIGHLLIANYQEDKPNILLMKK